MESDNLLSTNSTSSNQKRRPYHYTTNYWENVPTIINSGSNSSTGSATDLVGVNEGDDAWSMRANYSRYLYYNRLRRAAVPEDDDILLIPPHVIPTEFLYGYPSQFAQSTDGKQSSMITVFAIWNTLMGTSLLSMPWAMERAGIIPGITLLCLFALLSFYTAFRILQVFEAHENSVVTDFAVLCKRLLGKWAQWVALIFSVLTLLGACIVYWVLMSNFLYHTVDFLHTNFFVGPTPNATVYNSSIFCPSMENGTESDDSGSEGDEFHEIWSLHKTVPLFLIAFLGPLACVRSPTFFTKFNSLGTLSVVYLIVFSLVKGASFGVNVSFTDDTSPSYIPLYKSTFPALAGMLSLAFFIHNCLITIMKNNRFPENNKRDLSLAYILVVITYFFIGGSIYLIFPLEKMCIEDNFLSNFRSYDLWAFTARIFLFFQMITVFPLLSYILRVQVVYSITKKEATFPQAVLLSTFVIVICVCFAIWLPRIGTIIRFTGAICGLVYLFFLPICLYLKWQKNIGQLTPLSAFFHVTLLSLGLVNFVAQFLVHVD